MATALVMAGAACGNGPTEGQFLGVTVRVAMALGVGEHEAMEELFDRFSQQTGARILFESTSPGIDLFERLRREVVLEQVDVELIAEDSVAIWRLVQDPALLLVDDVSDVEIPSNIHPATVPDPIDGVQYFLPFRPTTKLTYYNTSALEGAGVQPPRTVEELIQAARVFRDQEGVPKVTLAFDQPERPDPVAMTLSEWIVGHGGDPLVLNDAGSVQAFQTLQAMWQEGLLAPESDVATPASEVRNLTREISWINQNFPFAAGVLYNQEDEFDQTRLIDDFSVYEGWSYPARPVSVLGGDVMAIPFGVEPDRREAAVALAEFLMSEESQEFLIRRSIRIPEQECDHILWLRYYNCEPEPTPAELDEAYEATQRALAHGWYRPSVPYWPFVRDAMAEAYRQVIVDGRPVQETLDEMHDWIASGAEEEGVPYPPR